MGHSVPAFHRPNTRPNGGGHEGVPDREPAWWKGSALHDEGGCKPCAWYWKGIGCHLGADCDYCHLCPRGALHRARAAKVNDMKNERRRDRAAKAKEAKAAMQLDMGAANAKGGSKSKSKSKTKEAQA